VEGVNNHMGSAATSDLRVMRHGLGPSGLKRALFRRQANTASDDGGAASGQKRWGSNSQSAMYSSTNDLNPEAIKKQYEAGEGALA